jgi:hypothetical protein
VKRLKGNDPRKRRDAEGFDDTNTYSVLAAEVFYRATDWTTAG